MQTPNDSDARTSIPNPSLGREWLFRFLLQTSLNPLVQSQRHCQKLKKAPVNVISSEDMNKKDPSKDSPERGKGKRKMGKKSPPLPPSPTRKVNLINKLPGKSDQSPKK